MFTEVSRNVWKDLNILITGKGYKNVSFIPTNEEEKGSGPNTLEKKISDLNPDFNVVLKFERVHSSERN